METANTDSTDIYREYFFGCRQRTEQAFDEANRDGIERAIRSIGSILTLHVILNIRGATLFDCRFDAFALLKSALDMLVSALHLARQRDNVGAGCLLRAALESACTALHISTEEKAYTNFTNGTYHSTKSIAAAKRHIPVVGQLWGALSEAVVHTNAKTHGPRWRRGDNPEEFVGSVDFEFQAIRAEPIQDSMTLTLITLTAEIVARAQEISLLDDDPTQPGWRKVPGTTLIFCSGTDKAINDEWERFRSPTAPPKT